MSSAFTTRRMTVRRFRTDDWEDLADILTDKEVTYFEPYETFTREACVKEAASLAESSEFYAVELAGKVIGKIFFSDKGYGSSEIGYTFNRSYQGCGLAYESVTGMMGYAYSQLGVRRIFAQICARNIKSVRLAERLGMRREALYKEMYPRKGEVGVFDDFYVYAMLDKEYEAIHSSDTENAYNTD